MFFDFFKKKSKTSEATVSSTPIETPKILSISHKDKETSDIWPTISANEIWDRVDEVRNSGKHNIVFKQAIISKSVASELREAGLRIKICKSTVVPQFEVFC